MLALYYIFVFILAFEKSKLLLLLLCVNYVNIFIPLHRCIRSTFIAFSKIVISHLKKQKQKIFCSIDFLFDVFPINKKVYVAIGLKSLMVLDLDLLELLYNIQKQLVILRSYFKHLAFIRVLLQKLNCPKSF